MTQRLSLFARFRREARILRARTTLRLRGVSVGRRPLVQGWLPFVQNLGSITIGERFEMQNLEARTAIWTAPGAHLRIGDRAYVNSGVTITAAVDITIGDDVKIAGNAAISSTSGHELVAGDGTHVAPVTIGNNVWIGRGAFVLPGVNVGDNAIIGAGSVVNSDVTANTVVAGSPARVIRTLRESDAARR